jgi:Xaa-Pro aminopeptidase
MVRGKRQRHVFHARREALARQLKARRLAGMLLSDPADIFYLTGFRGSAGVAFLGGADAVLWVDPRYSLQAGEQASGVRVSEVKSSLLRFAGRWLSRKSRQRIGYEDTHLTCQQFSQLEKAAAGKVVWVPYGQAVRALRAVKDEDEIETIRRACRITSQVYEDVLPQIRPGVSELQLAAEIEYRMKCQGADGPAFETIVASGQRAALPHARPSSKLLEKGELVILDLGAILHGYASDMTRTVYLGRPDSRIRRLYARVEEAQRKAVEAAVPGVEARNVDAAARRALARHGLDRYFTHSTGHGVGIEIHEEPKVGRQGTAKLKQGSVITVEPGVYLEGLGGVRIEDTLVVTAVGAEILTPAPKNEWVIR